MILAAALVVGALGQQCQPNYNGECSSGLPCCNSAYSCKRAATRGGCPGTVPSETFRCVIAGGSGPATSLPIVTVPTSTTTVATPTATQTVPTTTTQATTVPTTTHTTVLTTTTTQATTTVPTTTTTQATVPTSTTTETTVPTSTTTETSVPTSTTTETTVPTSTTTETSVPTSTTTQPTTTTETTTQTTATQTSTTLTTTVPSSSAPVCALGNASFSQAFLVPLSPTSACDLINTATNVQVVFWESANADSANCSGPANFVMQGGSDRCYQVLEQFTGAGGISNALSLTYAACSSDLSAACMWTARYQLTPLDAVFGLGLGSQCTTGGPTLTGLQFVTIDEQGMVIPGQRQPDVKTNSFAASPVSGE